MSKDPVPPAEEEEPTIPPPKAKRKPGFKHKMALIEIIERKRLSDRVDYKAVAARHGLSQMVLRQLYSQWQRGMVDLGEPQSAEEKQIDARVQHEKTLQLLKRYQAVILNGFEGLIFAAEDEATKGKPLAWKKLGLPSVVRELKEIMAIRKEAEKGYNAVLEEEMMRQKSVTPTLPAPVSPTTVDVQARVVSATDEQRAMEAFQNGHHPTAHVPGQTPPPVPQ